MKIEELVSEKNLAEAMGISRQSLAELRRQGLPWVSIAGKVYYYEPEFMEWVLGKRKRVSDLNQTTSRQVES